MTSRFLRIAIVLGLISAIGPFAIDMYLPALPTIGADDRRRVHDGLQRLVRDRERQHAVRVMVHDGVHVGARRIDGRMDHSLAVRRAAG